MTTLAVSSEMLLMVADGVAHIGDRAERTGPKMRRHRDCIVGCAGTIKYQTAFHRWISGGREGPRPKGDYEALLLYRDGRIGFYEESARDEEFLVEPYYAIGSGSDYALAALDTMRELGLPTDPRIAVKVACHRDSKSGEPLQELRWRPAK